MVVHIDNLRVRPEFTSRENQGISLVRESPPHAKERESRIEPSQPCRGVSVTPRDIREDSRSPNQLGYVHPDRISQVYTSINEISDLDLNRAEPSPVSKLVEKTEQFIRKSRKERKAFKKRTDLLSRTRSGKVITKPLSEKQRSYLQLIPKDTIAAYLEQRK